MRPPVPRERVRRAVVAALSASPGPMSRLELELATGFTGVQVATLLRELAELKVVAVEGSGRSSRYQLTPGVDVTALPRRRVRRRVRRGF